jgi:hypothetical protein
VSRRSSSRRAVRNSLAGDRRQGGDRRQAIPLSGLGAADPRRELAAADRILRALELGAVEGPRVRRSLELDQQGLQTGGGERVLRRRLERAPVVLERRLGLAELALGQLAELVQDVGRARPAAPAQPLLERDRDRLPVLLLQARRPSPCAPSGLPDVDLTDLPVGGESGLGVVQDELLDLGAPPGG